MSGKKKSELERRVTTLEQTVDQLKENQALLGDAVGKAGRSILENLRLLKKVQEALTTGIVRPTPADVKKLTGKQ